jgi:FkbM family methyltransferase
MYSQNQEEKYILEFFKGKVGRLLDVGANDGQTLSNSKALIDLGWSGDLVEPSPVAFNKLFNLYALNKNVTTYNFAISSIIGDADFYESGSLLKSGDTSLVSSLKIGETDRWRRTVDFDKISVPCMPISCIDKYHKWDFITIDAEGMDVEILRQIILTECELLCIEWNSIDSVKKEILEYTSSFEMDKILYQSGENLLICRKQQ